MLCRERIVRLPLRQTIFLRILLQYFVDNKGISILKKGENMRYFAVFLILTALASAGDFGNTETSATAAPVFEGNDNVNITILNDWVISEVALGLDILEGSGTFILMTADPVVNHIQFYDPTSCNPVSSFNLDSANGNCFGVVCNGSTDSTTYYTNDWLDDVLYYTEDEGVSWTTTVNPSGHDARGMDFDGVNYWTTNGSGGGVWRFQPGVGQEQIPTPEVTGQPSGLCVFPRGTNLGIAITTYTDLVFFYEWDGSTMSFLDGTTCIPECQYSMGLAYSTTSGTFFWSYLDNSDVYHISEFTTDLMALTQSSWGSIKSSF